MRLSKFLLISVVLGLFTLPIMSHAQSAPARLTYLEEFGYGDIALSGMYGAATVFLPFPSYTQINTDAEVLIQYTASSLLNEKRSTLTVFANDLQVASIRLVGNGNRQQFRFRIPAERLRGTGIALRFEAYLSINDEICEPTNNPGQWLKLHPESHVVLSPEPITEDPTLDQLPTILMQQNVLGVVPPITFVLPQAPTNTDLTTAARLAGRLAHSVAEIPPIGVVLGEPTDEQRANHHLVMVGTADALPLDAFENLPASYTADGFLAADGSPIPGDHAAIQIWPSTENLARRVLLVSGGNADGLNLAGNVLQQQKTYTDIDAPYAFLRSIPQDGPGLPPPWTTPTTTFAQFEDRTRRITGTGIFEELLTFPHPAGHVAQAGATLTLDYAFSPVLRPVESYIAAYINEIYIGTARIGAGVEQRQVVFELPVDQINQVTMRSDGHNWRLRLQIANFLTEQNCEQTNANAAWTEIYPTSSFNVAFSYQPLPNLQLYPYPFVDNDQGHSTAIVLPDDPTAQEIAGVLQIAAYMGQQSIDGFNLEVVTAGEFSAEMYADHHLLLTGTSQRLPLLGEVQAQMNTIPDPDVYQALNSPEEGVLHQSQSPWNSERIVLLAYGQDETKLDHAQQLLQGRGPGLNQAGSVVLASPERAPQFIYRPVELLPRVNPEIIREPLIPTLEPWFGVTLILSIGGVLVLGVLGWAYRKANAA